MSADNHNAPDEQKSNLPYSWLSSRKIITTRNPGNSPEILLDENYEQITSEIPGLKIPLYNHQKTALKALIDLENTETFNLKLFNNNMVKTNAGMLSEPVGSGKTIEILALILFQKIPKNINLDYGADLEKKTIISELKLNTKDNNSIIHKTFKSILTPTIVFVGVSVINQWVEAVKSFTNLKYLVVSNVKELEIMLKFIVNKTINNIDIILIKNGKITRMVNLYEGLLVEYKNTGTTAYIYNVISNLRNICWARVVIDDFDTIGLPSSAGIVNGIFTWYISSTHKFINNKFNTNLQFKKTSDMLMYSNYSCSKIMDNNTLLYNFNIRNSNEFIKLSTTIYKPKFYAYILPNPDHIYLNLLSHMGQAEINEILEMLNGDAISTAAGMLGITTNKISDLFQNILGQQYKNYKQANEIIKFINNEEQFQGHRKPMSDNDDEKDTYNKTDLLNRREILFNYPNLKGLLDATKTEFIELKDKSGLALTRVKNNIKNGECPICLGNFSDEDDIIILKCCNIIICGICCFGTIFPKSRLTGKCGNCRFSLGLNDLIYLNKDINLDQIINDDVNFEEEKKEKSDINEAEAKAEAKEFLDYGTKPTAIYKIITNTTNFSINNVLIEKKSVNIKINNLMYGDNESPEPNYKKVLIFANYDEILCGTHSKINETVKLFTACAEQCVLIINSMNHCSGLNLQSATDIIFVHRMIDHNRETQAIGRGQRLGRSNNLKVHYLCYENEYSYMINNNIITESV